MYTRLSEACGIFDAGNASLKGRFVNTRFYGKRLKYDLVNAPYSLGNL